ncbi:uncharacterized protein GGS22DRAFT_160553 [Annulohypoxylon maeteangense]|uniref:uncharacterized protein n=1 Tax=Annulohypoxylon maeteangense TaxID=1927788 RepID=UPI002007EEB4|nr:uncharacterized protein GGS22DRAFT_160553 [Annulohypoxylon maeteangense]KAI0886314.1 hypothetical protein GGS22DRAFT_160553 [Annulohypoxylon maeteangense]
MDNWETQQTATSTPQVKFEASPAESLMSVPGDMYPSLFATSSLNALESAMTPQSFTEEKSVDLDGIDATPSPAPENGEKKPTKKRKSWGQVLPEPKTNLPPRKRAKTEDEKEQRRVERVLRNRRAAQSSRERKRQEVEALEQRNQQLEELLRNQQKTNEMLMDELNKLRRGDGVSRSSSPLDAFQPSPLTLSQPLFGSSQDGQAEDKPGMMNDFILMPEQDGTVDPASLSPELTPVPDDNLDESSSTEKVATAPTSESTSTDAIQHPAAVLCDLQCPSVEVPRSWVASQQPSPPALSLYLQLQTLLIASSAMLSAFRHPLTLIRGALKTNLVLHPTPSILSTIIWLVTRPPNFRTSTSTSSSAPTTSAAQLQARPREAARPPKTTRNHLSASSTLRIKSLQKILTSSPILARPLKDATMELLRLVSEKGRDDRVEELAFGSPGIKGDRSRGPQTWPDGTSLPSREVLLTLMWAITVEERKFTSTTGTTTIEEEATIVSSPSSRPGLSSVLGQQTPPNKQHFVLSVTSKGERDMTTELGSGNRIRLSP